MKRKIKALGILLSDFYKAHEKKVDDVIFSSFTIVGAICLAIFTYIYYEPREITKTEMKYCEEKVQEIINSDLKSIPNKTIKEMRKKGYNVDVDVENRKITVGFKGEPGGKIVFSYSKKELSKKVSYSTYKQERIIITLISLIVGACMGLLVLFVIVIVICVIIFIYNCIKCFFTEFIPRIKNKYKEALKKVDTQNGKGLESECIEHEKMECIEEKDLNDD